MCIEIYVTSVSEPTKGCWIDANQEERFIREEIRELCQEDDHYIIADYRGFFNAARWVSNDIDEIVCAARLISDYGELASELICDNHGNINEAKHALENDYVGEYVSLTAYARSSIEKMNLPNEIVGYIDFEKMGKGHLSSGRIFTVEIDKSVHVFRN